MSTTEKITAIVIILSLFIINWFGWTCAFEKLPGPAVGARIFGASLASALFIIDICMLVVVVDRFNDEDPKKE